MNLKHHDVAYGQKKELLLRNNGKQKDMIIYVIEHGSMVK